MKKIMVLASAVAMACAVNAASFSWGFMSDSIVGPDGYNVEGFLDGGYASLFIGETLVASAHQDTETFMFGVFDNTAVDSTGKVQALADGNIGGTFAGQAYKLVLRTNDDKYEIVYNGVSTYSPVTGAVGEDAKNYEQFVIDTAFEASAWTEVGNVPEPTSGLLLLLGVAGLALKRKRT